MRAVDTNVLVRLVTRDDAKQVATAEAFVARGAWVPHLVLAEAAWVLTSVYNRRPEEIATAIEMLLNHEHLTRAHRFFEQYGGKAVILGRFVPIVRTFVPFVAGAAEMRSHSFVLFNLVGAVGWVGLCLGAGLLFGNVPIVKENFSLVTIGIVAVSLLPMVVEYLRHRAARAGTFP